MLEAVRQVLRQALRVSDAPPHVPAGEGAEVFRASPRFLQLLLGEWALRQLVVFLGVWLPLLIAVVALVLSSRLPVLAVTLGALTVLGIIVSATASLLIVRLDFDHRWYVLTDRALRIREGIWTVREVTLTLANVQDIKVHQGPIQRLLGLHDLIVDTAGGGGRAELEGVSHQGRLRGVEVNSDLADKIRRRVQQRKDAGLGDHDDEHEHHAVDAGAFIAALTDVRDEARRLTRAVTKR